MLFSELLLAGTAERLKKGKVADHKETRGEDQASPPLPPLGMHQRIHKKDQPRHKAKKRYQIARYGPLSAGTELCDLHTVLLIYQRGVRKKVIKSHKYDKN